MDIIIEEEYKDPVKTTVKEHLECELRDSWSAHSQGAIEDLRNEFDNLTRIFSRLIEYLIEKDLVGVEDLVAITKEYYDEETDLKPLKQEDRIWISKTCAANANILARAAVVRMGLNALATTSFAYYPAPLRTQTTP